jgi:hypothetical protein
MFDFTWCIEFKTCITCGAIASGLPGALLFFQCNYDLKEILLTVKLLDRIKYVCCSEFAKRDKS